MVILKGTVKDGKKSSEISPVYISGAVLSQSSGWSTVADGSGYFYTSANVYRDLLTVDAAGYRDATISIPIFATQYDPGESISGSLTQNCLISGVIARFTDSAKHFTSNSLSGRTLTMQTGIDIGQSTDILSNTENQIFLNGTAPVPWAARYAYSSVVMGDGSVIIAGGSTSGAAYKNDVWRSTDNGVTWTQQTLHAEWSPRNGHACIATTDNRIILIGGVEIDNIPKNDVWESVDYGATWTQNTASADWLPRYGHSAIVVPDIGIVIAGGFDGHDEYFSDVWRSTNNGVTWTVRTAGAEWISRRGHVSIYNFLDNSIFIMGGYESSGLHGQDVWKSVNNGVNWALLNDAGAPWSRRKGLAGVMTSSGYIIIMGGSGDSGAVNDVWITTDGLDWVPQSHAAGWAPRSFSTAAVLPDDTILLMGGTDEVGGYFNDIWRSTDLGVTWTSDGSGIANAQSGDIYNISWVSSEPIENIQITMWGVAAYPGSYKDEE